MFVVPLDRSLEIQFGNIDDTDGGLFLSLGQAGVGGSLPLRNNPGAVVILLWPPSHVDTPKWDSQATCACARHLRKKIGCRLGSMRSDGPGGGLGPERDPDGRSGRMSV